MSAVMNLEVPQDVLDSARLSAAELKTEDVTFYLSAGGIGRFGNNLANKRQRSVQEGVIKKLRKPWDVLLALGE